MSCPGPGVLLEFHFEELDEQHYDATARHLDCCVDCRRYLDELDALEVDLATGVDETPPVDGLERVLARIGDAQPAQVRRDSLLKSFLPSTAAIASGVAAVFHGGLAGALAFFLVGALVTLAIAPVLILESQRRTS